MTDKKLLRREAERRRHTLAHPGFGAALAGHAEALKPPVCGVVSGYCAFRDEADPQLLMRVLGERGLRLALPAIVGPALPLRFHLWRENDAMVLHAYGVREPQPEAEIVVPDVLLVPLLAFDRSGYRLGYGGGYYDRTLEALRALKPVTAIGIAYAGQEVPAVPHEEYDQRLDAVLTEEGLISCA